MLPSASILQAPPVNRVDPAAPASLDRVDPADLVDPANIPVVRVDLADLRPVARVALGTQVDRADPVDLDPITRADPVGLAVPVDPITPVGLVDLVAPAGPAARVDPVAPGTETLSAATSTARRGATGLALGARARRRDPRGTVRCRLRAARGTTARSTTSATRKPRSGTPDSTRGASGSSECGSRCKDAVEYDARFATWRSGCRPFQGLRC